MSDMLDVAVVGGGIAGLTLAWRLQQQRPELLLTVLEASDRPGGRIRTERLEHDDGRFVIDLGADSMVNTKPWGRELCCDLGLADELISVEPSPAPTAIWRTGYPVDLPAGLTLLAPTQPEPFLQSPLLSDEGKRRALREPEIPARESDADESLGSFIRRRFGREYLDGIGEPLLAGIYNADPNELSLMCSFPNFRNLERMHGSVIRGAQQLPASPGTPPFSALRSGMQRLPDALAEQLGRVLRTGCRVARIERCAPTGYRIALSNGESLTARSVVLAAPLSTVRVLLPPLLPSATTQLDRLEVSASGAIVLAWRDGQIARPLAGFGLVMPKRERQPFNAVTVMSKKYSGRAPAGWTLMRFFFGGFRSPQTLALADEALLQTARDFAFRAMGIQGEPAFVRIARWPEGSPIYQVGHLENVSSLEAGLPEGLYVTGSPFRGPGIPDVVHSATELANRIAASFVPATAQERTA